MLLSLQVVVVVVVVVATIIWQHDADEEVDKPVIQPETQPIDHRNQYNGQCKLWSCYQG
mgnify:CR=1 FL=1